MARTPLLLLVRHGKAEDDHPLGDEARGLTPKGREAFRNHAERIATHVKVHAIVTSPLVRAVQTAELLAHACGVDRIDVRPELVPEANPERLAAIARELGTSWALVGHNPSMHAAAGHLLGLPAFPEELKKGEVLAFSDRFQLAWSWRPGKKPVHTH